MKIINDKGFSIIQGLMLAGLLSGTALVTSQLVSNQKKAASSVESKDSVDNLAEMAYSFLQHPDHCRETIIANSAHTTLTGTRALHGIYAANRNAADGIQERQLVFSTNASGNKYFSNNVQVSAMRIIYGAGNFANLNPAVIEIDLKRNESRTSRTGSGLGGKDSQVRINIVMQRDGAAFSGCYAVKTAAEDEGGTGNQDLIRQMCLELGNNFQWNGTSNTCTMRNNTCPTGRFFTGINSTGTPICRTPREGLNINQFLLPEGSYGNCYNRNGVRLYKSGNRVGITCV